MTRPNEETPLVRTIEWDDPHQLGHEARELSGIEFMRRIIDEQRRVPIGMTLGFKLVEVGEGLLSDGLTVS